MPSVFLCQAFRAPARNAQTLKFIATFDLERHDNKSTTSSCSATQPVMLRLPLRSARRLAYGHSRAAAGCQWLTVRAQLATANQVVKSTIAPFLADQITDCFPQYREDTRMPRSQVLPTRNLSFFLDQLVRLPPSPYLQAQ